MPYMGKWQDMPEDLEDLEERIVEGYDHGVKEGIVHGIKLTRKAMVEWLFAKYMDPSIERKSPEGHAILQVAADIAAEFDKPNGEFTTARIEEKGKRKP